MAEVLKLFEFRHGMALPNVRHAIERLASLSAMELCVLSAIMRRSVEDETLSCLGISHTWYHAIKTRLSAMFQIVPSCLCEMKYSDGEYALDQAELERMIRRRKTFRQTCNSKKSIHLTLITANGLRHNNYSGNIQSELTLADLFRA